MKRRLCTALALMLAFVFVFAACDKKEQAVQGEFAILDCGDIQLEMGQSKQITVLEYDGKVTWKSGSTKVVNVSGDGVVTTVAPGETAVTAKLESGTELNCMVTVVAGTSNVETIKVSGMYTAADDITVDYTKDKSVQLKASCDPYDPDEKLTWKSSDEAIAVVDNNGLVSLTGNGSVTITATAYNGVEGKCIVRAKNVPDNAAPVQTAPSSDGAEVPEIENNPTTSGGNRFTSPVPTTSPSATSVVVVSDRYLYLDVAEGYTLTYAVGKSTEKKVEWISSDRSVAIVDKDGCVVGISDGTATISAVTTDGAVAHCKVAVGADAINALKKEAGKK